LLYPQRNSLNAGSALVFWVSYQLHVGCGRCCFQLGSSVAYSVVIVTDSNNNSYWRTFTQTVWLIVVVRFGNLHKHTREPQNIVLPNMCDSFMYKSKIIPSHTLDCILVCTNCCVAVPLELTHLVDAQIFDTICKAHINPTSSTIQCFKPCDQSTGIIFGFLLKVTV